MKSMLLRIVRLRSWFGDKSVILSGHSLKAIQQIMTSRILLTNAL